MSYYALLVSKMYCLWQHFFEYFGRPIAILHMGSGRNVNTSRTSEVVTELGKSKLKKDKGKSLFLEKGLCYMNVVLNLLARTWKLHFCKLYSASVSTMGLNTMNFF